MDQKPNDPEAGLNSTTEQLCTQEAHLLSLGKALPMDKMRELPRCVTQYFW